MAFQTMSSRIEDHYSLKMWLKHISSLKRSSISIKTIMGTREGRHKNIWKTSGTSHFRCYLREWSLELSTFLNVKFSQFQFFFNRIVVENFILREIVIQTTKKTVFPRTCVQTIHFGDPGDSSKIHKITISM